MTINIDLEKLYHEDKEERESIGGDIRSIRNIEKHTRERLQKIKQLLPTIDLNEIWNCHYLAYLLQHGDTSQDYKLAHEYAKKAVDMGSNVTKWLYAATLDRYLVSQNKKQKFGTQFRKVKGEWHMLPVDETTTDKERKKYNVPPLTRALQQFQEKYKQN